MGVKNNIIILNQEVSAAGARLIAVSKTQPVEKVMEAYDAGHRIFGENKVQEMTPKYERMPKDIEWHMIGHLQSNKVKHIAPFVSLIHSVDSFRLLEEINKQGKKINRVVSCLLQVYIAEEDTKFGFDEGELFSALENPILPQLEFIRIEGLMGMASLTDDQDKIRREFRNLKKLFTTVSTRMLPSNARMNELSMGMSSDYRIALEEGSTLVRIGTAIFRERQYNQTL